MLNSSYKKSHISAIPKITLLSLAEKSSKLNKMMSQYDKTMTNRSISPQFRRNWTISPKKFSKKASPISLSSSPIKFESFSIEGQAIDQYISTVLKEYQLEDIEKNEKYSKIRKFHHSNKNNVFDKYFDANGAEEEKKLIKYIENCKEFESFVP